MFGRFRKYSFITYDGIDGVINVLNYSTLRNTLLSNDFTVIKDNEKSLRGIFKYICFRRMREYLHALLSIDNRDITI